MEGSDLDVVDVQAVEQLERALGVARRERPRQQERALALVRREQLVPGGEGEAVVVADRRERAQLEIEREVGDHTPQDLDLLRVLLAEVGEIWADDREELQAHRRDPAEMPRPEGSLQNRAELGHVDPRLEAGGVHLLHAGSEDEVDTGVGRRGQVARLVARILGEVAVVGELGRVDEQAHDDGRALRPGRLQQRDVPGVQCAHRRDEADRAFAGGLERRANLGDRAADSHATATVASARTR